MHGYVRIACCLLLVSILGSNYNRAEPGLFNMCSIMSPTTQHILGDVAEGSIRAVKGNMEGLLAHGVQCRSSMTILSRYLSAGCHRTCHAHRLIEANSGIGGSVKGSGIIDREKIMCLFFFTSTLVAMTSHPPA